MSQAGRYISTHRAARSGSGHPPKEMAQPTPEHDLTSPAARAELEARSFGQAAGGADRWEEKVCNKQRPGPVAKRKSPSSNPAMAMLGISYKSFGF